VQRTFLQSTVQENAATHYNTLQLQHTAMHLCKVNSQEKAAENTATPRNTPQHPATSCNTLQHPATHCSTPSPSQQLKKTLVMHLVLQ